MSKVKKINKKRKPKDIVFNELTIDIDTIGGDDFIGIRKDYKITYYSIGTIRAVAKMLSNYDKWKSKKKVGP